MQPGRLPTLTLCPREMRAGAAWCRIAMACAGVLTTSAVLAQTPNEPAARPPSTPAAPAAVAGSPSGPANCSDLTERAASVDVAAARAQAQRTAAAELAPLIERSIDLWRQASEACTGRAQTRALRSLADSQRLRQDLGDVQGSGARCSAAQRDAQSIEELAKQAVSERRWRDAALLFRRAENSWDVAAESCVGPLQEAAVRRRLQVETDGHNAEYCGPPFDEAAEFARRMRLNLPSLAPAARQAQQQMAETLWRDAAERCKDRPLEIALSAAQTIARERGTPWVAARPPAPATGIRPAPVERTAAGATGAATAATGALQAAAGAVTQATASAVQAARSAVAAAPAAAVSPAPAPAPPVAAPLANPTPVRIDVVLDGGTRMAGVFTQDPSSRLYSGQGRVQWPNGDVYEGEVRAGMRHGTGEIQWASGQRYRGQWVDDRASGRGVLSFPGGNEWEGEVIDGQPQGTGRMRYASGDVYTGEVRQGVPEGQGAHVSANGDRHEGLWAQGRANGKGVKVLAQGGRVESDFRDGLPHGQTRLVTAAGDEYVGPMVLGQPDGPGGVYRWANGQVYEGPWAKGSATGRGRLVFANGNTYVGEVVGGQPDGTGTLTYASGDVYVGRMAQGLPDGQGRYAWKNGDLFEGAWKRGRKEGAGVMRWSNGDRWEGLFADDAQTAQGRLIRHAAGEGTAAGSPAGAPAGTPR